MFPSHCQFYLEWFLPVSLCRILPIVFCIAIVIVNPYFIQIKIDI